MLTKMFDFEMNILFLKFTISGIDNRYNQIGSLHRYFMKNNMFESEFIKFWIEEGMLFGSYTKGLNIDIGMAKKIADSRVSYCKGKDYPHILEISGITSTSREAREYFSKDQGTKHMKSLALIVESPLSRTIGNFFLILNKPKIPTKIFTVKAEAAEWSRSYL